MKKDELLIDNVVQIMQLQALLKISSEYLNTMYMKTETDDPTKKEALFEPLNKAYNAMLNIVDKLQHNANELTGIDQGNELRN